MFMVILSYLAKIGVPITVGVVYFFKKMTSAEELAIPNYEAGINLFGITFSILSKSLFIYYSNDNISN
jgi:hypothetical protein